MRGFAVALAAALTLVGAPLGSARAGTCAQTIGCGVPVTSDVDPVGEIDCHTFSGTANEVVSIGINSTTGGTFSPRWTLRAPGGASVGAGNFPDRRTLTLPTDGTYTIEVNDNGNDHIGTYTVSYVVVSDAPGTCASPITCGTTLETNIATPTEADTYSFAATAGEMASITTTETTAGLNVCWELYGPTGISLATSCAQRAVYLPTSGIHTIRVSENGDDAAGPYDLNFTIVTGPSQCGTPIACGDNPSPVISPRAESDTFAFTTALDRESVRISTTGAGGAFSPCWTIFAAPGAGATPDATPTPVCGQADASLPHAGTHVIRVSDANDDATGPYGLGLQCLGTPTPTFTPNPTLTPTATSVTPTPTPTPIATPSLTPDPNATATPVGPPQGLADPVAAKRAVKCQRVLMSAGAKLVSSRLKRLDACSTKVLECVQTKPGVASCRDKASVTCAHGIAKLADDETKLRKSIVKSCSGLSGSDRGSTAGLGFDSQVPTCNGLGSPVGDPNGLAGCVAIRGRCDGDDLADVEEPRTGEMLRLVGATLEPDACLTDFGGVGEDVGDPGTVGVQVVQCAKAVTRAGRTLAATRLVRTGNCVNAVFACVQLHPGDPSCLTKAAVRCGTEAAKIVAAEAKFAAAANKKCPAIPFATLGSTGGLSLMALNPTCTALGVGPVSSLAGYQECLRRSHVCDAGSALAAAAPRAGEMLAQVGRLLLESFCPPQ